MNEIKADLIVFGGPEFDPEHFQQEVGLPADRICRIGEAIGRTIRTHKSNAWIISTGYSQSTSMSSCVVPLLKRLEPFWQNLCSAIRRPAEAQLSVAAYVDKTVPSLSLDRDALHKLAELNASLDIDIILMEEGKI